jgi:hypothetical protein
MAKLYSHNYTPERLALDSRENVETVRKNAIRLGAIDLVEMCDRDLESRKPAKREKTADQHPKRSNTDVVVGYHFVCERDRGVTQVGDGSFWSGSWVVSEDNVKASLRYGAYLALHESRSDLSCRQGQILNYRRSPRDMLANKKSDPEAKIEEGIEFLVRETNEPFVWVGAATGEKGYRWAKIASVSSSPTVSADPAAS